MTQAASTDALMGMLAARAKEAAPALARARGEIRNRALLAAADALAMSADVILSANRSDLSAAHGLSPAMQDRLRLDEARIGAMAQSLREIAARPDPLGRTLAEWTRPNGLRIARVSVPIGVIAIIFESRPNVVADAGGLCLKSGNVAILRAGSEAQHSAKAIAAALEKGVEAAGLPSNSLQLVPTTDRAAVGALLSGLDGAIDLIIPRGGRSLVERVAKEARAPVLGHLEGVCHVYIDRAADPEMAARVLVNAKLRRTGVCGAAEKVLIDRAAAALWPGLARALEQGGCEIRADSTLRALHPGATLAGESDITEEYLAPVIAAFAVDGVGGAIAHINRHGTGHTDAIVTADHAAAERFLTEVDSAIVLHNASTQFADGGEFGLGAEIGIATGRLHARGPVGADELTTYKNIVRGDGHTRP